MSARLASLGGVALGFGALVLATFSTSGSLDYDYQVAPAMNALLGGNVGEFFQVQPVYGGFAVLARLPFAALARLGDGGDLLVYKFGVLPCIAALGMVGLLVTSMMRAHGQPALARFLVGALLLVNPVTLAAIERGHPEELLAAALVLGGTVAAIRSHPGWAAILLGLALATKQWTLIAAIPVLLACAPRHRVRVALVAAVLAATLIVPMAVANSDRFVTNNRMAQGGWGHASRLSVWWPLGSPQRIEADGAVGKSFELRKLSPRLSTLARPAVVVVAVALSFLFWLRRRRLVPEDTLGLLALLLLLRCVLDPMNNDYYHAPFLLCLVAWEGLRLRGVPVLSLLAAAGLWATTRSPWLSAHALGEQFYAVNNLFYLSWTLMLAGWIAFALFGRRGSRRVEARLGFPAFASLRTGLTRAWIGEPRSAP